MEDGIAVEKVGRCVVVRMERGENRLNMEFIEAMNRALDQVERYCNTCVRVSLQSREREPDLDHLLKAICCVASSLTWRT